MADPYFIWRGEDSRDRGLWVTKLPAHTRPVERVKQVTIPGRPGQLTITQGDDIYDGYDVRIVVQVDRDAIEQEDENDNKQLMQKLLEWLRGESDLIVSNAPDFCYYGARIINQVQFDKVSNSILQANIDFFVHPYRGAYPKEQDIIVTQSGTTITNPGDVTAFPLVEIHTTQDGDAEITIGDRTMQHTHLHTGHIVDCDAQMDIGYDHQMQDLSYVSGDFWTLPPGESVITWTGVVDYLVITPRWRYL